MAQQNLNIGLSREQIRAAVQADFVELYAALNSAYGTNLVPRLLNSGLSDSQVLDFTRANFTDLYAAVKAQGLTGAPRYLNAGLSSDQLRAATQANFTDLYTLLGTVNGMMADFAGGAFRGSVQTFARNSAATRVTAAKLYESVSANVLRLTYDKRSGKALGALIEESAQNLIRNAVFAGLVDGTIGSGGSYPTNFQTSNSIAMPPIDVSAITVNGQPGMRLRIHGTPAASGGYFLQFDSTTGITVAVNDVLMTQLDLSLSAGSVTNVASITAGYVERNSSGTFLSFHETSIYAKEFLDTYTQRILMAPVANAAGARACPFLKLTLTSGQAVDIQFDISAIGLFKQSQPTTDVYSSGSALTRASDDLAFTLPSLTSATYLIAGEPRLASDGKTLAHLVDGAANGLRFYRSGFSMFGVIAEAGVDGTPVELGKCLPGAPLKIAARVIGAAVTAALNGKAAKSIGGTGVAYSSVYAGEKSDKTSQWNGTVSLVSADSGAPNLSCALVDAVNDWDQADGSVVASGPGGFNWQQVPANGASVVLATVSSGGLVVAADSGSANTAAYTGTDLGTYAKELRALISWGAGTAGGSVVLICNPNGLATVANITGSAIHIVYTLTTIDVAVFDGGIYTIIKSITMLAAMAQDGTKYAIGWELDGNTLIVTTHEGRSYSITDARFGTLGGRYATFEHFWQGADKARPTIHAAYARAA
ncbi:hypothetical protein IVB08_34560 [Bradyrhizobium sp. 173]|uniref:hypothetical protein n=1 Tax=Bradyrhizobium sp. 173 TaxID=2782644 RepID=UPI001FF8ECB0|nr:hypothetical protein [Bradyrhizobium sp. 173]MCK1568983.1 hypothetical protein [Bradyrhizobium sp. 173]